MFLVFAFLILAVAGSHFFPEASGAGILIGALAGVLLIRFLLVRLGRSSAGKGNPP